MMSPVVLTQKDRPCLKLMRLNVLLNHDDFVYVNYIVSQNAPPPIVNEPGKVILQDCIRPTVT